MRTIGKREIRQPSAAPSAGALREAPTHQAAGRALAAMAATGVRKGIYRFASPAEMNRHADEALARAIALNLRRRAARP